MPPENARAIRPSSDHAAHRPIVARRGAGRLRRLPARNAGVTVPSATRGHSPVDPNDKRSTGTERPTTSAHSDQCDELQD